MQIGIIVCIILTLAELESGDMFMTAVFGGLSVLLIYLKATEKTRKQRKAEEAKRKTAAELRIRANQLFLPWR